MVKQFFYILAFSLLLQTAVISQEIKISEKQNELKNLKEEITSLQKELSLKSRKERASFTAIENYNHQGHLLNKMINRIREEENLKQKQILNYEEEVKSLRKEIRLLQDNYAKYVTAVYKYGKVPEWTAFVDADSLNQAILRIEYLRRFAARRESDLKQLQQNKEKLVSSIDFLEIEKKEKSRLALQKQEEEKSLLLKLDERKKILSVIKNDKAELKKELNAKKNSEAVIRNLIARLVEEAERKRKEEAERLASLQKEKSLLADSKNNETVTALKKEPGTDYDVDLSTSSFSSFAAARGKLSWPLSGGTVLRKYGENRNKKLNTVTMNYGIDIKAGRDLNVRSVADGVISAVEWVPGFGSVIIITHKGDYRTVYSHLSGIFIKEGDRVQKGTLIAKTAEGTDGNILHFEIWNSRSNQDPEKWLQKR